MVGYTATNSTGSAVPLYLPEGQWDYLRWLMSQGFDLDHFTKTCDARRRTLSGHVPFADFVSFATDRLHQLHYMQHPENQNLMQPVFRRQITQAVEKAEAFFRSSGRTPMRWSGWRA